MAMTKARKKSDAALSPKKALEALRDDATVPELAKRRCVQLSFELMSQGSAIVQSDESVRRLGGISRRLKPRGFQAPSVE
jgi:hypothetical protein